MYPYDKLKLEHMTRAMRSEDRTGSIFQACTLELEQFNLQALGNIIRAIYMCETVFSALVAMKGRYPVRQNVIKKLRVCLTYITPRYVYNQANQSHKVSTLLEKHYTTKH
uniref:Uncharacterized protein n=1 Tax=Timema bartmani TaxID=61472 RepID=A0A7R9I4Z2_9NEOP|nr:unnamed protein product [Timema bartmani]